MSAITKNLQELLDREVAMNGKNSHLARYLRGQLRLHEARARVFSKRN